MTDALTEVARVTQVNGRTATERDAIVVRESSLTIILNRQEVVKLLCSGQALEYLAIGFLASEGFITERDAVADVVYDQERHAVAIETHHDDRLTIGQRYITSSKGATFQTALDSPLRIVSEKPIDAETIYRLMKEFQQRSAVFQKTGGVHSAALSDGGTILVFHEDIGRHNAIDKVLGEALWNGMQTDDKILLTSGRIPGEIIHKVARFGIPIIVSKSAPTGTAVRAATEIGVTLVGFVRGDAMNIYAGRQRILT